MMAKGRRRKRRINPFRSILLIINVLLVVATFLAYASNYISPEQWKSLAFAGLLFPFLLIIHVFMILFWLFNKPKWILLSLFTLLAGFNITGRFFQLNYPDDFDPTENIITTTTFNAKYYSMWGLYGKPRYDTLDSISDFFNANKPDILCIQEAFLSHERTGSVADKLRKKLGYTSMHTSSFLPGISNGLAIYHNETTLDRGVVEKDGRTIAIWVDLKKNGSPFRVYSVHLQSTGIGDEEYVMEKLSPTAYKDSLFVDGSKKVVKKLLRSSVIRSGQVDFLKDHIAACPYPVIVCSDLNDTPCSYAYTKISRGLRDSFIKAGRGLGRTYQGKFPSFRIDYIFASRNIEIKKYVTHHVDFSDHNPVFAWLALPDKKVP